jgi:hypothetical protein
MQHITKLKLASVHQICDVNDKSTEFTLQLMQDTCNVSNDTILNYMSIPKEDKLKLFKEINSLTKVVAQLESIF